MKEDLTMLALPVEHAAGGALVPPAGAERPTAGRVSRVFARLLRDSAYVLTALPWAAVTCTVLIAGLSFAALLLVVVIGIPIAVATLRVAVAFAALERRRLEVRGTPLAQSPRPIPVRVRPGLRAMVSQLSDRGGWAEVVHGIVLLPLAAATWSVVTAWWAASLAGLTYWAWSAWLPPSTPGSGATLSELLNLPISDSILNLAVGLAFAATLVPIVRGCANLHESFARALLSGTSRRELAARVDDLTLRRAAAASAEAQALRRFERDLHDGPQQRLVRLGMDLSVVQRRLDDDPARARELLGQARNQVSEALAELRALSRGIAPPILADRGLEAALAAVAARSTAPTTLDVDLGEGLRLTAAVENAAYFVVCEALTNTAKHAAASSIAVRLRATTDAGGRRVLCVEVEDDGIGGADLAKGHGLAGLSDRVVGLDGTLSLDSPAGGPTRLVAELPC